ncbi:MAG: HDIG domain-containing protein, partial [Firmicutes bacterium]|nr:HDIG domain-containing protein [Bacillota bacterium]
RKLSLEAPGTYHHSIVVGNLAEAAAEAIGADSLLTRVGAMYHDVGKLARPYFFVENQRGENPHDKMSPNLSRMVILNHVKEGLELAKEYKLPKIITDFISEHHGTSTVKHFYQKAKEKDQNPVLLEDFSYPGPKPHSKETAILMIADSAEAAVRSMTQPTYDKIQSMIKTIAKAKLEDEQLSHSTLTLREIDVITEVMSRVAAGIHHNRLKYPGQKL